MAISAEAALSSTTKPKVREGYPADSLRFDWIVTVLSTLFVIGIFIDGWAHNHNKVDNTFFTPWHAMLYGGFAIVGAFLALVMGWNYARHYPIRRALPRGYAMSMVGVLVFAVGGVGDLIWHTLFGIELSVDALLSPTHLILGLGVLLIATGPVRAAWLKFAPESPRGWLKFGPMIICSTLFLSVLMFFTQYAHPLVNTLAGGTNLNAATHSDLYIMNVDGSGQTRLTMNPKEDHGSAAFSPDDNKIAYSLQAADGKSGSLYEMKPDGTGQTQLTHVAGINYGPAWTHDGSKIAFVSMNNMIHDIYSANADGSSPQRLTTVNDVVWGLSWSPDGKQIVFSAHVNGAWTVNTMNADGSNLKTLTSGGDSYYPSWSPDGSKILFYRDTGDSVVLYTMNADGSRLTKLNNHSGYDPRWSPDGSKITFASDENGRSDIYSMNADGSDIKNLTNSAALDSYTPSWSADGTKIVYEATVSPLGDSTYFNQALGVSSILLQAGLLMGVILFLVRRWTLPFGSLSVIIAVTSLMVSVFHDHYELLPGALIAGILADVLLWRLKPSAERPGRFYLLAFAVPALYYVCYFIIINATQGINWTIHMWAGAIVQAGVIGLLVGFLLLSPFRTSPQSEPHIA